MKICAIICEYNPFHNGHKYLIRTAKEQTGADAILCIMSGNFVQRGQAAVLEKHIRAKHAALCGADAVIELPTVFATSNAEIFARGAISILSKIPEVSYLCFGAETADKQAFLNAAHTLLDEPESVSAEIKRLMKTGMSYAAAISQARAEYASSALPCKPNNILGLEYTKALLLAGSKIDIVPIQRVGAEYHDNEISPAYSLATAIRNAAPCGRIFDAETQTPKCVFDDLLHSNEIDLSIPEKLAVMTTPSDALSSTLDCSEGLENAFKSAACLVAPLDESLVSARYTASRIRRIALQNLLQIRKSFVLECLQAPLYLHPLAYKADRKDLLSALSKASIPFLAAGKAKSELTGTAKQCLETDELAEKMYAVLAKKEFDNKTILV